MYIHLGRDYVLNDRDIIGIFDPKANSVWGFENLKLKENADG